jgi:hypothetical protein
LIIVAVLTSPVNDKLCGGNMEACVASISGRS